MGQALDSTSFPRSEVHFPARPLLAVFPNLLAARNAMRWQLGDALPVLYAHFEELREYKRSCPAERFAGVRIQEPLNSQYIK